MQWGRALYAVLLLFSIPAAGLAQPSDGRRPISDIMSRYNGYDMDGNGTREIVNLSMLPFEAPYYQEVPANARLVLVLVESRLLQDIAGSRYTRQDVLNRLERWKGELRAEGYYTRFVEAQVYNGTQHQDGQTVLAIRKFFQEVYGSFPNFQGAMLVGSFPEAMLVREWLWKRDGQTRIIKGKTYTNVTIVQRIPERISHRTDIILADLNGGWEKLYEKQARKLSCLVAMPAHGLPEGWPQTGTGPDSPLVTSLDYEEYLGESLEDFFYVKDATMEVAHRDSVRIDFVAYPNRHPELHETDRALPNPTAQPEITVSRINTRHIAFSARPESGLVDATGAPKSYTGPYMPLSQVLQPDPALERTLLIEYFDRNHLHRVGGYNHLPFNLAATAGPDFKAAGSIAYLSPASNSWNEQKEFDQADLVKYVDFLKYPAAVKGYRAHGGRKSMEFFPTADLGRLGAAAGTPYNWTVKTVAGSAGQLREYTPTYQNMDVMAGWALHRTLWQHKKLAAVRPSFYFFFGCEANSPAHSEEQPYNHVSYGEYNNAENILYFLNGLAAVTRAKTFNDDATGFPAALNEAYHSNLADGWKAHYRYVATHTPSSQASGKRSYWWSVLGDWTLRLRYGNGAALIGLKKDTAAFEARAVLADRTTIGSHYAAPGELHLNLQNQTLLPAGDVNNDKRDDFLVVHDQGIGVAYQDGLKWRTLLAKPSGAAFGNWTYTGGGAGSDKIEGHGDFDGDGSHEILIRSASQIGMLKYDSVYKTFNAVIANPAGTVYTDQGVSWTYQSTDVVEAVADFNGDKRDDILIRGNRGRVVLSLLPGKLYPLMVVPYNTSSPGPNGKAWLHAASDKVAAVADFSVGSTRSILLVSATKGLGILNVNSSIKDKFLVQNIHPAGTRFGAWTFNPNDKVEAAGDFTKDGKDELLVTSSQAIGLLTPASGTGGMTFNALVWKPRGTGFGSWLYSPTDNVVPDKIIGLGDFDRDGAADVLIQRPHSALGILKLNAAAGTFTCPGHLFYNNALTKPIDGWYPTYEDVIVNVGNYDGLSGAQLLVYRKNLPAGTASARTADETEAGADAPKRATRFLYPNPATYRLGVRGQEGAVAFVEVYTLTGALVMQQPAGAAIDVSALLPGTYLVHLKNAQGVRIAAEKLVKQ